VAGGMIERIPYHEAYTRYAVFLGVM
jgi:hypothetical protein